MCNNAAGKVEECGKFRRAISHKTGMKDGKGTNTAADFERLKTVRSLYLTVFSIRKEVF